MKKIDKYYKLLELFDDCQEKATIAIRDLAGCSFRTAKIRNIITNPRYTGINENFNEIVEYIDKLLRMYEDEPEKIENFLKDKDNILSDDYIFTLEELDTDGLNKYKEEMGILGISDKLMEYLFAREITLQDKANKAIVKRDVTIEDQSNRLKAKDALIKKLRSEKATQKRLKII